MTSGVTTGRRFAFASLVLAAALVGMAATASAHSELVSSDPAAGSTVARPPSEVSLTFNEPVQEAGSSIVVTAGSQEISQASTFAVDETSASIEIDATNVSGAVEVAFRVVSEDGHVVRDTYSFEVSGGTSTQGPDETPTVQATPVSGDSDDSGGTIVWVLGLGAIGLVLIAALVAVGVRGRRGPSS